MHGGANLLYPAMHGGGVGQPRSARLAGLAYVDPAIGDGGGGLGHPAVYYGGLQPTAYHDGVPENDLLFVSTPGLRPFCLISNKFIKNLNLNIYLMILILYYKY